MLALIWCAVVVTALALFLRQKYSKFQQYDVKHFKPVPLMGNMTKVFLRRDHMVNQIKRLYDTFYDER
jgi:hypothetical protein